MLFPTACSACGKELSAARDISVCSACWESLQPWTGPICAVCGLPLASAHTAEAVEVRCGDCQTGKPEFDVARTYGLYTGVLRTLILELKFRRRERLGRRLGELLFPLWSSLDVPDAVVVPVPLHPSRQRERGFNQAQELAFGLARLAGKVGSRLTVSPHLLRTRATVPQTGLSIAARQENVRGVFAVRDEREIQDQVVVLIDDVMTTGATVSACAAVLRRAGAARVIAMTLARATPQFPDFSVAVPTVPVDEFGRERT